MYWIAGPILKFRLSRVLKLAGINNQAVDLIENKQTLYGPIYSLGPVKLETPKTYVETNLTNASIRPSKSTAGAPMLISLEAVNLWIAWAVPDVVCHPVGSNRRIPWEEDS